MRNEENVDERNDQTEAIAEASVGPQEVPKPASTVLGKFKDVDALAKAYESLQAEFTRRSQKLRALEKEVENFKGLEDATGAEKLRKAAKSRREAAKEFDEFVAEVSCSPAKEKPTLFKGASAEGEAGGPDFLEGEGEVKETEASVEVARGAEKLDGERKDAPSAETPVGDGGVRSSTAKSEGEPTTLESLYKQASENEAVRLRIVGEYLASLGKSSAPLTGGGAGLAITPPARAKSVGEAGEMALLYFRKPAQG